MPPTESDDRALILLRAARDILRRCSKSYYVRDVMSVLAYYDEAECDGNCLMEDIEAYLDLKESAPTLWEENKKVKTSIDQ
jgi:hypothetical protein